MACLPEESFDDVERQLFNRRARERSLWHLPSYTPRKSSFALRLGLGPGGLQPVATVRPGGPGGERRLAAGYEDADLQPGVSVSAVERDSRLMCFAARLTNHSNRWGLSLWSNPWRSAWEHVYHRFLCPIVPVSTRFGPRMYRLRSTHSGQ